MAELVAEWAAWQQWRGLAPRTINVRTQVVTRFARHVAPRTVFDAADGDVVRFLTRDITPTTRSQYLSHLSCFYQWATDRGYTDSDPTSGIQRPKVPKGVPRPVAHDDAVRAIDCAGPKMRAWLLLGLLGGLRCVEICRLEHADIGDGRLRLTGKGGRDRYVPLHELVQDALDQAPPAYNITPARLSQKIGDYLDGLGLEDTAHSFRHAFATNVYSTSGFDILLTSELLGHASVATTQVYTRVDRTRAEQAVRALTL